MFQYNDPFRRLFCDCYCHGLCFGTQEQNSFRVIVGILLSSVLLDSSCFRSTRANTVQPVLFPSSCCSISTAAYFKSDLEFKSKSPPSPRTHSRRRHVPVASAPQRQCNPSNSQLDSNTSIWTADSRKSRSATGAAACDSLVPESHLL